MANKQPIPSIAMTLQRNVRASMQLGFAFHRRGDLAAAKATYESVLKTQPKHFDALRLLGTIAVQTRNHQTAIELLGKAIAINSGVADTYSNRGAVLVELRRYDEALSDFDRAIALNPQDAVAHNNRANLLRELRRFHEALASYDNAIAADPDFALAHNRRGRVLERLNRLDEALISHERALKLQPDGELHLGDVLATKAQSCDWRELETGLDSLKTGIRNARKVIEPWLLLGLLDEPDLQKKAAAIYAPKFQGTFPLLTSRQCERRQRIRIGYYSADFHDHATTYLMAELFELHDAAKFEVFGFSFGPNKQDKMRKRVSSAFYQFFDVRENSTHEVVQLSRELGIDIAVDLKGYTLGERAGIFAERCAPIQVNYLGYPGTMGAAYIDYIIADPIVIPRDRHADYTEKVVYLPHTYQVNDSRREIADRSFTREECGLPPTGFVFCCFNNSYKILPAIFDVWMNLLKSVQGSVLWLLADNETVIRNLRREAELRGVEGHRLVFAGRRSLNEHLARHRLADLFLDTLPCNAHTTASDALWTGLPVLTCAGKAFASRVAASLLHAIGLPDLVTHSLEAYRAKAFQFATNPGALAEIKARLERNRLSMPLFDATRFTRHIEAAYEAMYDRYVSGLAPQHIAISFDGKLAGNSREPI